MGARPEIAALVLAAGRSSRMGSNKLLARLADGRSVVEHVVDQLVIAAVNPVIVVVGHEHERVRQVLRGREIAFVENPDYAQGLSSSLQAGVRAVPATAMGFFVSLGDMPAIGSSLVRRMAAVHDEARIVVPMRHGRRGNPVLWGRGFIAEFLTTRGDVGAKHLIQLHSDRVVEIEAEDDGIFVDLDTPQALDAYRRHIAPT